MKTVASAGQAAKSQLEYAVTDRVGASQGLFYLYLYFIVDFFFHLSQRIPGYGLLRPTLLLVLLIFGMLVAQKHLFANWHRSNVARAFLVLVVYIVLTLPLVEWPGSVIKNNVPEFVKAVVFLIFTSVIIDSERRLKVFLVVFVSAQLFRILEPLFLNVTQGYWGSRTHLGGGEFSARLAGAPSDVINPNELGFVIATAFPFVHYFLLSGRWFSKLLYFMLIPLMLYALVLTQSRGAIIAMAVVGFFIFKKSNRKILLISVAILAMAAGWSKMSDQHKDRYLSLIGMASSGNQHSVEGRFEGMAREFSLAMERPIIGHGLGTTKEAKFHHYGQSQASHNLYAELWIELGFIGFVIFIYFLYQIYRQIGRINLGIRYINDHFYNNLRSALIAVFWMYAVYSINYWGLSQYYWYLFAGLTMVVLSLVNRKNASKADHPPISGQASARFSTLVATNDRAGDHYSTFRHSRR